MKKVIKLNLPRILRQTLLYQSNEVTLNNFTWEANASHNAVMNN